MKTVIIKRLCSGKVTEEKFTGKSVNWTFETNIFRIWDSERTLAVPYQMLESVEIKNTSS